VDYGIRGLDLAYALLEPFRTVILVDAIAHGGIPGTVYILQPADSAPSQAASIDPHSMDPASPDGHGALAGRDQRANLYRWLRAAGFRR
jgi:hydrogenase maturation protease